jgi:hypothetical protein
MVVGVGRETGRKGPCEPQNAFCGIPSVKQYIKERRKKRSKSGKQKFQGN